MKNLLFAALCIVCFGLTSCGGDDECKTCTASLVGIDTSTEVCEDGDGLSVTTEALGTSSTETVENTSLSDFITALEAGGYTCN